MIKFEFFVYSITPERFEDLAKTAAQLFTSYLKESFYTSPTSKSNAHGVLQGYYENIREKAISIKLIQLTGSHKRKREEGTVQLSNFTVQISKFEIVFSAR